MDSRKALASELFNISRNTINLWLQRSRRNRGFSSQAEPSTRVTTIKSPTGSSFGRMPTTHGDKTQVEMAQLWEGDISESVASKAKRRSHNLTSLEENWVHAKKKTYGYQERDESKRQTFIEQVAKWADEIIVYVDEAGMDNP
jgi:hypothetical protein